VAVKCALRVERSGAQWLHVAQSTMHDFFNPLIDGSIPTGEVHRNRFSQPVTTSRFC